MQIDALLRDIRLHQISYSPASKPKDVENTSDNFLLILPLTHGRLKLERGDAVLHDGAVQPGTVRIVRPGEFARLTPGAIFESAVLAVPELVVHGVARDCRGAAGGAEDLDLPPVMGMRYDVQRLIPLLRTASDLPAHPRSMLVSGLVLTLLALALNAETGLGAARDPGFEEEEFDAVLSFARSRLGDHLDLAEWAEVVKLSTNEFARRFQQHTGVAPYTWFLDRRIDEAKRLMVESHAPLVEIALDSGFCSQSHFTEAFRRRVGTSPGRWRSAQAHTAAD